MRCSCPLFLSLMFQVAFRNGGDFVGRCMRVEYSYIEKVFSNRPPQNAMLSLALSGVLEVVSASPVSGCRLGSTMPSRHTSVSRPAVMSRILLWRMVRKPPLRLERVCRREHAGESVLHCEGVSTSTVRGDS